MKKKNPTRLDFVVDKLTDSIINTISNDSFTTDVFRLTHEDLKQITKKNGWNFNWKEEFSDDAKEVYKLTITNNKDII